MNSFRTRIGGREDLELLLEHRLLMWKEIHPDRPEDVERSRNATRAWIEAKLETGEMVPFIAETTDGIVAGSGCLLIKEDQVRPFTDVVDAPYLLSMYTVNEFRSKGVASRIVRTSVEWATRKGYDRMTLHASTLARHLYERFGFEPTNEMRVSLRNDP